MESLEECEIANFLYVNGVNYIYEHPYKEKTSDAEHGQYKPDFTLPEFGIYIEHFGIDKNGGTAPWGRARKRSSICSTPKQSNIR